MVDNRLMLEARDARLNAVRHHHRGRAEEARFWWDYAEAVELLRFEKAALAELIKKGGIE